MSLGIIENNYFIANERPERIKGFIDGSIKFAHLFLSIDTLVFSYLWYL